MKESPLAIDTHPENLITVPVALGDRAYNVLVGAGLCRQAGHWLTLVLGDFASTVVMVSNPTVWKQYGDQIEKNLKDTGIRTYSFLMGDGERFKNLRTAEKLWSFLIEQRIERRATLLALGGGVVGDMTGFVAATYLRGVPYVQVPTTLLAQIDSSVGGKTAINHPRGKNLIGAFHQPALVLVDTETLVTLPRREWNAGWCEALKYGVIRDEQLFAQLEQKLPFPLPQFSSWTNEEASFLTQVIARCCQIKAAIVVADERETGERRILNFGHTVGHALEAVTNYRTFRHGEAVGYGMLAAFELATALGFCPNQVAERVSKAVHQVGNLPKANHLDPLALLKAMQHDKKSVAGNIRLILPKQIGEVFEHSAPSSAMLLQAIKRACSYSV